jgi:hypothetical protein
MGCERDPGDHAIPQFARPAFLLTYRHQIACPLRSFAIKRCDPPLNQFS